MLAGLAIAAFTGEWRMKEIYTYAYSPLCAVILLLGLMGKLPRVGPSTKNEGTERRYFYGSVWAVTIAQTILLIVWKILPVHSWSDPGRQLDQVHCLRWHAHVHGHGHLARNAAPHPAHPARRTHGLRLERRYEPRQLWQQAPSAYP